MADEDGEQGIRKALDAIQVIQSMIDVSSVRLNGLRTQCETSAELTQQEIRTLEGKLIKLFSRQLVTKAKLREEDVPPELRNIPSLTQWLQVVGLYPESIKMVCGRMRSLEALQDKSERDLKTILGNAREEELRRLCRALHNLKKYTEVLVRGGTECEMALYWDSWDRHHLLRGSPRPRARAARASVPSEDALAPPGAPAPGTCPHALPLSRSASSISTPPPAPLSPHAKGKGGGVKFPTTPPARRKLQTGLPPPAPPVDVPLLTKSKSHESQLGLRLDGDPNDTSQSSEGVCTSPPPCSPVRSPPSRGPNTALQAATDTGDDTFKSCTLTVPRSPRTPNVSRGMGHYIEHRFTKTFKMIATCDYCDKQMFLGAGLKCKECKYKCHRDCQSKVPPSCGLPPEFVDEFKRKMQSDSSGFLSNNSPSSGRSPQHVGPVGGGLLSSLAHRTRKRSHPHQLNANVPSFPGGPDSSSNTSSCNSSTPSSPALLGGAGPPGPPQTPRTPHNALAPPPPCPPVNRQQFNFPGVLIPRLVTADGDRPRMVVAADRTHTHQTPTVELIQPKVKKPWPAVSVEWGAAGEGEKREVSLSGSASEDSERTPGGHTDSAEGDNALNRNDSSKWPRQNSLSMKEWDIPYDELAMGETVGTGRFGTVYRGSWHGDVAVKLLNMHNLDDEAALEHFKLEVATFRKTRHENLVLFMGACMKPPRLAIVTSLCKGMTLYTHIHLRKDKFNMNKTTIVAQQISQGMGYLHARGIVHKDLKSKNIFLENGKVVITDFGLFSVTKLCFGNSAGDSLGIPAGWLCYLAPELVRGLRPSQAPYADDLPFTKASDVYAFGTVWYELLCGEWPFKGQPPEAVIWQVGKGVKQTLANLQASRDVKDILMLCWSYRVTERPDFARLLSTLEKLPRKRLARSPSHPVHLSRSAESVF